MKLHLLHIFALDSNFQTLPNFIFNQNKLL